MPVVDWNLLQRITADSLRVYETIHRAQKMNEESERILRLSEDLLRQAALAYLTENALPEAAPNPTAPVEAIADAWVQVQQAYADLKAALRSLARAKREAGQWEESRTLLLALLHLEPEDADAAALLTEIYLRNAEAKFSESKWDEGRAILEQAMRSQPVDKKRCRPEILRSFVRAGDPNGLASYEPRVEKSPAFQRWVKASRELQDFESAHLPIGSGIVESGAKQAKQRLCAPGMRWSRAGLENMLPLRAALMSGTFDQLWPRICPRL